MESNKRIPCKQCQKSYVHRKDLLRHIRNKHGKDHPRSLLKRSVVDDSGGATKKLRPPSSMVIPDDPEIKVFVQKNIEAIQKRKRVLRACQSFNFPLKSNNITPGLLLTHLDEIYGQASGKFKVQMGIGRILRNKENEELKYWRAEHCDSHLLQNQKVVQPMKVNSRSDLKQIAEQASNLATEDYLQSTRPDTKWELVMPTNVRYYISYTDFVAGYITENLPDYLLSKESVNCLHRDYERLYQANGYYQDKLCFFRCLPYHKLKHDKYHKLRCIRKPLNLLTHQLYYDYNKEVNQHRNQEQVGLDQLLELEAYFKVNIEVYRCHEDSDKVDHVYKSVDEPGRGEKLYLDLYVGEDENHFSYINSMQSYSHRFQCMKCEQDFRTVINLNRHEAVCDGYQTCVCGGFKKLWPTLFECLQHYGIEVNPEDRFYKHFIVFDCESILSKTEEQQGQARMWNAEHIPVSIAMSASFLPLDPETGFPSTECVVSNSPEELVKEFLCLLMEWREPLLMHLNEKYQYNVRI